MSALEILQFSCLTDNYCVLLHAPSTGETAAIDAPDGPAIEAALAQHGWSLTHILITHHHGDHTAGNGPLKARFNCRIIGPQMERDRIPGLDAGVAEGSDLMFAGHRISVLDTPGHTAGHVAYVLPDDALAFTGDTLFAMGCGRLFESDAQTMWRSLQKLATLPDDTRVYCGHEYTLANGRFALTVEPENATLQARVSDVARLRAAGQPCVPTTIRDEKRTNPFLRAGEQLIRAKLGMWTAPEWQVFERLRELKNKS